eukprot:GGOE01041879.1.p1 GENE.GGOE01041879.1~~GGOE01041879.1.p1  ORF type:complete len:150 (-),score=36.34 GGOE01041879.1:60-509(-)
MTLCCAVPFTVVGHSDAVTVGEGGSFLTSSPCTKCQVDLQLDRAVFLNRICCTNAGTCFVTIFAGPEPTLLAAVLPRHPTNSMLRHKVGLHCEDPLELTLRIPDAKCNFVRLTLEQPYEPSIPIGVPFMLLFLCELCFVSLLSTSDPLD